MRPCNCDKSTCRLCHLWHNDPRYQKLWGHESPGIITQVATFAKAVARHVAAGCPTVTPEEKVRRLALCRECPEFDAAKTKCRKCGCRLNLKVGMATETCPLEKW